MRSHTKNWGFLGRRLGTDDFDRPEAAESKHDSKDDSNGMANIQAPACKWCCCQFLVRYSDETDPGDGGGEGQREEDEYDAEGEKNSSKNTYFQLLKSS